MFPPGFYFGIAIIPAVGPVLAPAPCVRRGLADSFPIWCGGLLLGDRWIVIAGFGRRCDYVRLTLGFAGIGRVHGVGLVDGF
jgi:hypothetical protein